MRVGVGGEAAGGAAAGRRTLDFESLAFAQGGHLMANKKCDLPKGSYRTAFKVPRLSPRCCIWALHTQCGFKPLPRNGLMKALEVPLVLASHQYQT